MDWRKKLLLLVTHGAMAVAGFAAGIYALPILIAPPSPSSAEIQAMSGDAKFTGMFSRDRSGSDTLHWGEGTVSIGPGFVSLMGELAPGPDYRLYLSREYVENEDQFNRHKSAMVQVGDVKTFSNFLVTLPPEIDASQYNTAVVWCETFGEFITSARYQ